MCEKARGIPHILMSEIPTGAITQAQLFFILR